MGRSQYLLCDSITYPFHHMCENEGKQERVEYPVNCYQQRINLELGRLCWSGIYSYLDTLRTPGTTVPMS